MHRRKHRTGAVAMMVIAMTALVSCSGEDTERADQAAVRDSSGATRAAATPDSAPAAGAANPASMADMDHAAMGHGGAPSGTPPAAGAAPLAAEDHTGHTTTASAGAPAGAAAGHESHAQPSPSAPATRSAAPTHAAHTAAAATASRAGGEASTSSSMAGMDHSRMTAAPPARQQPDQARASHEGHVASPAAPGTRAQVPSAAAAVPRAGAEATVVSDDDGTEKLLTLVRELVRDSVVRQRIQQDPELRDGLADPDVRGTVAP